MDAICVDKTGTLTLNRLSVVDVRAVKGTEGKTSLYRCSGFTRGKPGSIDMAFLTAAKGHSSPTR